MPSADCAYEAPDECSSDEPQSCCAGAGAPPQAGVYWLPYTLICAIFWLFFDSKNLVLTSYAVGRYRLLAIRIGLDTACNSVVFKTESRMHMHPTIEILNFW